MSENIHKSKEHSLSAAAEKAARRLPTADRFIAWNT